MIPTLQLGGVGKRGSLFNPLALYVGVDGAHYDASVLSSLYQDSAGTTPVTALGQPVGKQLDLSGNARHRTQATAAKRGTYLTGHLPATFGSELVTNGAFAADTDWTKGTGWTISGGTANATTVSSNLDQAVSVTAGKVYQLVYTVTRSAGTITPRFTGGTTMLGAGRTAAGTYTVLIRAETGNTTLSFNAASFTGTLDNVSLKEVLTCTGYPCIYFEGSGADQHMVTAATFTVQLPVYLIGVFMKELDVASSRVFGALVDNTNHCALRNNTTGRVNGSLAKVGFTAVTPNSANSAWPVSTVAVLDMLEVLGTGDIGVNAGTPVTASNPDWLAGTTLASSSLMVNASTNSGAASAQTIYDFGCSFYKADPGATNRAKWRRWWGAKVGLAL